MKAIILAAGRGSRMGKLTDEKPKCLIDIAGKTLLQYQLEAIRMAGINQIAIVRGYRSNLLTIPEIKFFENICWRETNMVASLICANDWLECETCIVSYSDIVFSEDAVRLLSKKEGDIVITYDKNWLELWKIRFDNPLSDAETFQVDDKGKLLEIGMRTNNIDEIKGQYMGLFKISPEGWKIIKDYLSTLSQKQINRMAMTSLLSDLIKNGIDIMTIAINDNWYEVDNENDLRIYRSINNFLKCGNRGDK